MKKSILALSAAALSFSALAASTTTLTKSINQSAFGKFIKSTKANVYLNAEKADSTDNNTTHTQYLMLNNTINSNFSTALHIRSTMSDVDKGNDDRSAKMIDPRFFLFGYKTKFNTSLGEITISPQLRTQIAINDAAKDRYATMRLGAIASMNTNAANSLAVYAGTYETITRENATRALHESSNIYAWLADTYSINDRHSFTVLYEIFGNLNQNTMTYNNPVKQNDLSLYYNNSAISKLTLSPYIAQNMADKASSDVMRVGIDMTYSF